jgi:sugar phosphate isomerase/epimerase
VHGRDRRRPLPARRRDPHGGWLLARAVAALLGIALYGASSAAAAPVLRVEGTHFVDADGSVFHWRGITAFRLVEFVAHGREQDADRYLALAASQHLTVVRVLSMAHVLFTLNPAEGEHALGRLLDLAARHAIVVEVVALADTGSYQMDPAAHVRAVGRTCSAHGNCAIEIANEPYHPTQSAQVHDRAFLRRLRNDIPRDVPVSLGTLDDAGELAAGDYITWHSPREGDWPERLRAGGVLQRRFGKPVVADEPMGAAARPAAGRRDNVPEHFARAARICRELGLGATFHYEGGLQGERPDAAEARCLSAWLSWADAQRRAGAAGDAGGTSYAAANAA